MAQPQAYLNGRFVPAQQLLVPATDSGFVLGVTVAEQVRTVGGRVFRLDDHLRRLQNSLQIVGVRPQFTSDQLADAANELVRRNHRLLADGDDLGLSIFVTPGTYPTFGPIEDSQPLVGMHTYPLPFRLWARQYASGQVLVTTDFRQVPSDCWPSALKCRSRMHYFLADNQARSKVPNSRALLLDQRGLVSEASTANIVAYHSERGLISPTKESILPGISLSVLQELAESQGYAFEYRDVSLDDLYTADEVMLTSTSPCLLPVVEINGRGIGTGAPGSTFATLIAAWSEMVGIDLVRQARQFDDHESANQFLRRDYREGWQI